MHAIKLTSVTSNEVNVSMRLFASKNVSELQGRYDSFAKMIGHEKIKSVKQYTGAIGILPELVYYLKVYYYE